MPKLRTSADTMKKKKDYATFLLEAQGVNLDELINEEINEYKKQEKSIAAKHSMQRLYMKLYKLKKINYSSAIIQILKIALLLLVVWICCQLIMDYQKVGHFTWPEWTKQIQGTFKSIYSFFTKG